MHQDHIVVADMVAEMVVDMEVDNDMVVDMEVDKVAYMEVDKVVIKSETYFIFFKIQGVLFHWSHP